MGVRVGVGVGVGVVVGVGVSKGVGRGVGISVGMGVGIAGGVAPGIGVDKLTRTTGVGVGAGVGVGTGTGTGVGSKVRAVSEEGVGVGIEKDGGTNATVGSGVGATASAAGAVGSDVGVTEARLTLRWVTVADDTCLILPARSLSAGGGAPRLTGATPSNPGSVSGLADTSELSALGRGSTVSPAQAVTINDNHKIASNIPKHNGSRKRG